MVVLIPLSRYFEPLQDMKIVVIIIIVIIVVVVVVIVVVIIVGGGGGEGVQSIRL